MMAQDPNGKLDALAERVSQLCEHALAEGGHYLVSRLGLDLGEDLATLKACKVRILDFLQDNLPDRFRVIVVGQHGNIQAIVKAGDSAAESNAAKVTTSRTVEKPKQRFNRRFWGAFSVPLKEGVRFVDRRTLVFSDREEGAGTGEEYVITPDFVVSEDAEHRDVEIVDNIDRWLKLNNLSAESFLQRKESKVEEARINEIDAHHQSVFDALLGALDRKQQASISLPLDIVATLMRARIRT